MDLSLEHLSDQERFVAQADDHQAILKYRKVNETVLEYFSTFVPPEMRGGKVGFKLVAYGIQYAKENNYKIIPTCWFVKKVMDRNEEYRNMIAN